MASKTNNDRYNALVHVFSRANEALSSEPDVEDFSIPVQWEMYLKIKALGEKDGFSLVPFLNDAYAFSHGFTGPFCPCRPGEVRLAPESPPILIELVRAFKNRAPTLGEKFDRVVKTNDSVATTTIEFLIAEYLYLDRSITHVEREIKNESFRIAMFNAHADALYIAAFNVIRSYAASMARAVLAADVNAAIGGENNAD